MHYGMKQIFTLLFMGVMAMSYLPSQAQNEKAFDWRRAHYTSEKEANTPLSVNRDFTLTAPPAGPVRQIAEFEPVQGVIVRYPFGIPLHLIKSMTEVVPVTTLVLNASEESAVKSQYQAEGIDLSKCNFIHTPTDSYWTRDYAPWWIYNDKTPAIVDNMYNRPRPNDDNVPVDVAAAMSVDLFGMDVYQTGGNYMCDGYGKAAQTELVIEENPQLTEAQIDQKHLEYLGIEDLMVINDPLGDYIKHIDCWSKFLDVDKVLVAEVPNDDPRYAAYEAAANYFKTHNSSFGKPYQVFRVMAPGGGYYGNATPYTNSLILNKHVFVPQSGSEHDAAALAVYEEAMPGYTIHGVNYDGWLDTDALHCRTRGIPDLEMVFIKHVPVEGDIEEEGNVEISAEVTAYSGQEFYADSVLFYYQENGGEWKHEIMQHQSGDLYTYSYSPSKADTEVNYYIYAADKAGKRLSAPMAAKEDPNHFTLKTVGLIETPKHEGNLKIGPNPCRDQINISFQMEEAADVQVKIFNLFGRQVMDTYTTYSQAGDNTITLNTRKSVNEQLSNGTYIIQLVSGNWEVSKKVVIIH